MTPRLTAITRYPLKSGRGESLVRSVVESWGLAGDRRWMVVDDAGDFLTARKHPRLLHVRATLLPDGGLLLDAPDVPELRVDPPAGPLMPVRLWRSRLDATLAGPAAATWLASLLGVDAQLVYLDDPTRRHANPAFARPDDLVSFADGYPLHVTTEASLGELNRLVALGPRSADGPLPMERFRPNVVVAGGEPWAEDGWRRIRIGAAVFRAVKGCGRCVMTLTDPDSLAHSKEPIRTLARYRQWNHHTWFGMNLVPDTPGAVVAVGDVVEIIDCVPAPDGPPR